jgi:hypothetical protein
MPLDPKQVAAAGDAYLSKLSADENTRSGLANATTRAQVANHISATTGMRVAEDDVPAIAEHLNANRSAEVEQLAMQHPAMGAIISESD